MTYRIELTRKAQSQIGSLPRDLRRRVVTKVDALATSPRASCVEKLSGEEKKYRTRVGDYRILYDVNDETSVVVVLRVGHRRDVYRRRD